MKIIYKQPTKATLFSDSGISACCLKQINCDKDASISTKKEHHHTSFEIHIIENGYQTYKLGEDVLRVSGGQFILIPPKTKHRMIEYEPSTTKFSLTFNAEESSAPMQIKSYIFGRTDSIPADHFQCILSESKSQSLFSDKITESKIYELLVKILRECGVKNITSDSENCDEDSRISIVKQYISDNIESNLTADELAAYCYLSTKQLTRIFLMNEQLTPTQYIHKQRTKHIEKLLYTSMSLREISEKMNFSSEYHFNSFFKKHAGMPPGTYRRMIK